MDQCSNRRNSGPALESVIEMRMKSCTKGDEGSTTVENGTLDYQGRPAEKTKTGGWKAASLVLGTEFCERLATLGIAVNLVTYLHDDMHLTVPKSANIVTNFLGTSYITCLLGGFIADTYLGRFGTIVVASCLQVLGMVLISISSTIRAFRPPPCKPTSGHPCLPAHGEKLALLYLSLYLTAFGTGGIKSSVSGFGADQFDERDPKERRTMASFFNWFFFSISMGALLSTTVLVYIEDNVSRGLGYAICGVCMTCAMVVLVIGTRLYRFKPPAGSPLTHIARVFVAAWKKRKLALPEEASNLYEEKWTEESGEMSKEIMVHTDQFRFLDKAAIETHDFRGMHQAPPNGWNLCTVTEVEEVKIVLRMLPIAASTILFYTAHAQMVTYSVEQGETLDRRIGKHLQIPPASLSVFLQISVLLTIVLYDRVLEPLAKRWRGRARGIKTLERMGGGLFLCMLAMAVAAMVERKRLEEAAKLMKHDQGKAGRAPLCMSVLYLVPQYVLVGSGEAFTYIAQLEFFYREAPRGMRSMATGLCLSTVSLGYFASSGLASMVNQGSQRFSNHAWLADDLNHGRLDCFYWLLAILSFLSFLLFLLCSHYYTSRHPDEKEESSAEKEGSLAAPH